MLHGGLVKYEALMRLQRVKNGEIELVSPYYFLEIAFKSKQYGKLTRVMIDKSFQFASTVSQDISINLSFEDIVNNGITAKLKREIIKYDIARQVVFEIVESSNIDDFKQVQNFIAEFRKLGVKTIAEFVSKKEIYDICYRLGVDYFQGYYFSEPLPVEEIHKEEVEAA